MNRTAVLAAALVLAATAQGRATVTARGGTPAGTIAAATHRWIHDLGAAPAQLPINLAVLLKYRHQAELDALVTAQSNPHSPAYLHFLTSDQFNAYFAPDPADNGRVVAALERAGFTVTNTESNRTVIDVRVSAATAERYFRTVIHRVQEPSGAIGYANLTSATIPTELQGAVRGVTGLGDLRDGIKTFSHRVPSHAGESELPPPDISGPIYGPNGGYGPLATAKAYDLPVQHDAANGNPWDGHGIGVAVGMWGSISGSDLEAFENYFNVQRRGTTYLVKVHGGGTYGDPGSEEATLDSETIIGNAPGVDLYVYSIPTNSKSNVEDMYNKIVAQNRVSVFNSSWGMCETDDTGFDSDMSAIIEQGTSLGIAFVASSGDKGALQCDHSKGVSYPASDTHMTAVGGTALHVTSNGAWSSETGWSGSGGGVSEVFEEPGWQLLIPGMSSSGRNVPDVAFDASGSTPVAIYYNGGWSTTAGTSWSSPLFCALQAEVVKYYHKRFGNAAPLLDVVNQIYGYSPFHDIKTGDNNGFSAHKGYDHVTGIGSVRGWTYLKDLGGG